ncbi:DUF2306 domain-containing protein [Planctobacterium marinum]|uniref:DUF2306 domain-containing protein n=1 Tax=Planctobacterium marinum TaxID=1631968 RepID=UPI001E5892F3|nr:DUF2306 domain-containing protein [Planctobacterium marinum]MCC2605674.1 DUF2306 domain-containing protein [Planctobacterium marinum]
MNRIQSQSHVGEAGAIFKVTHARKFLDLSVKSWVVLALAGQWAFATYILMVYALTLILNINIAEITPTLGYKKAEGFDFVVFLSHILPAAYLSVFGCMQLIPAIRNRFRAFHRWNGRVFFSLGVSGAVTGLYLQWVTGLRLSDLGSLGITLNGILILFAIAMAWRYAVKKRLDLHMRWAVHSFILVNAVWTFRLYLMGWYMVNQGPNGNSNKLDGPTDIFLSFACYLLPMLLAECYFWAKKQKQADRVWSVAALMWGGVVISLIGVISAAIMMWWPKIAAVTALL